MSLSAIFVVYESQVGPKTGPQANCGLPTDFKWPCSLDLNLKAGSVC